MYKIDILESENLKLMPYTTTLADYSFMLHKKSSYSIMDDYDSASDELFKEKINRYLNTDTFGWVVWLKKYAVKVGLVYYTHVIPNFSAIIHPILDREGYKKYLQMRNGDTGITIKVMEESSKLSIAYVMSKFNLIKITGGFFEHNLPAISLCKRLGFKEEGVLRNDALKNNKLINVRMFSLLREEVT